ncbi:MAG TPA: cupin domain-containing protein, partial [Gaiellaceae bacterium]|nr:cupin domain-containing protein [Gaiellaceae bacterium]
MRVIRPPDPSRDDLTGFDYRAGVVAETVASERLALQLVRIQPGVRSQAHSHGEHESAAYVLEGEVVTWYGEELLKHVTAKTGDFVFIPAAVPHVAANYGDVDA